MKEELETRIRLLGEKMSQCETGSVKQIMYREILRELEDKLHEERKIKLHVDSDTTCESCQ